MLRELGTVLKRSWQSHFWTNLATLTVLILSFSLILGGALVSRNLSRLFTIWGDEIQITVYLKDDVNSEQLVAIQKAIQSQDGVEKIQYMDKKEAFSAFEKSMAT